MFLCFRQDLDSIVVIASFEQRDEMIEANPDAYYTTDHHRKYPCVLARLSTLPPDILPDLLRMAWQSAPPKKRRATRIIGVSDDFRRAHDHLQRGCRGRSSLLP